MYEIDQDYTLAYLYRLTTAASTVLLTDYDIDLIGAGEIDGVEAGELWASASIAHGQIKYTKNLGDTSCELGISAGSQLATYLISDEVDSLSVKIYEARVVQRGNISEFRILFSGKVESVGLAGNVLGVGLSGTTFRNSSHIPVDVITPLCRYQFTDYRCRKPLSEVQTISSVSSVSAPTKVFTSSIPFTVENAFKGGVVSIGQSRIHVLSSFDDGGSTAFALASWPVSLTGSDIIAVDAPFVARPGCAKTRMACSGWNNFPNFGGFPFVPVTNPAIDTLQPNSIIDASSLPPYPAPGQPGTEGNEGDPYGPWNPQPNTGLEFQIGNFLFPWPPGLAQSTHTLMTPYWDDATRETILNDQQGRGMNRIHFYATNDTNYSSRRGPSGGFWDNVPNRAVWPIFADDFDANIPMPADFAIDEATLTQVTASGGEYYPPTSGGSGSVMIANVMKQIHLDYWLKYYTLARSKGMAITGWLWPNDAVNTLNLSTRWSDSRIISTMRNVITKLYNYQYQGGNLVDEVVLKLEADDEWSVSRINNIASAIRSSLNGQKLYYHNQADPSTLGINWALFDGVRWQKTPGTSGTEAIVADFVRVVNALPSDLLIYASEYSSDGFADAYLGDALIQAGKQFGARFKGVDNGATPSLWSGNQTNVTRTDAIDLSTVTYAGYGEGADLTTYTLDRAITTFRIFYDDGSGEVGQAGWFADIQTEGSSWPTFDPFGGDPLSGIIWVFIADGAKTYAIPFEAYREGYRYHSLGALNLSRTDLLNGTPFATPWVPVAGTAYGFCLSTNYSGLYPGDNGFSRSNVILRTWPS